MPSRSLLATDNHNASLDFSGTAPMDKASLLKTLLTLVKQGFIVIRTLLLGLSFKYCLIAFVLEGQFSLHSLSYRYKI